MTAAVRRFLVVATVVIGVAAVLATRPDHGWPAGQPIRVRRTGRFADPRVVESSGVVRGLVNPDVLWTLNDSGNEPLLFAFDTTGAARATVRVTGVPNVDWEAIGAGPCGAGACLYVGDIGDNRGVRRSIAIYRVPEPPLGSAAADLAVPPLDSVVARYPDGPHDAEALVVTDRAEVYLVTKGRDGWVGRYRLPPDRWGSSPATLDSAGRLPIPTGFLLGSLVTDAALSPDGAVLAVRTYRTVYLFDRAPGAAWLPAHPRVACPVGGLDPIGEGIAWLNGTTLIMTSERGLGSGAAPITALECPAP